MNALENMIGFDEKVRVFISSRCGEEKYDNIRMNLKTLIEKTGFAKVYLFEGIEQATTLSAEQDYLYGIDDCDVCIFLIDNADGVPEGVLKEYQRAKAHPKKSIYVFCNENNIEPTQIQKELSNAKSAKYYTTESFEKFVKVGYDSLINDIGKVYISYCKGRLIDPEFSISTKNIEEIDFVISESLDKQIFKNIDKTKQVITREIHSRKTYVKIEKTCDLDNNSAEFLNVLFGKKTIMEFNTYFLLTTLKCKQSENLHKAVTERWKAIQHYWMDDLAKSIEYEKKALSIARELQLPNWFIQDILIDLRNLYLLDGQEKNYYFFESSAQKELDSEESALFYPLLDRYDKLLYEEIIKQLEKDSIASPYSTTWGNSINMYGDYISNIYIVSVFNGSLTHLVRIRDRIKDVIFNLCKQYSDWEFRVALLKTAFFSRNKNEIKGVISLFNDVYGKINAVDSLKIYEYCKGHPIRHHRIISQLISFQHLGYYFSEEHYSIISNEIMEITQNWIVSKDKTLSIGDYIFEAIRDNLLRLDNNQVIENIIIEVFVNELRRFYDDVLDIIFRINFKRIKRDNRISIIKYIESIIEKEEERNNCNNLEKVIISLRKQNTELTMNLHEKVQQYMPFFYKEQYSLEVQIKSQHESEEFIKKNILEIKERNETQGKDGRYIVYWDNPYKIIKNIIKVKSVGLNQQVLDSIINVCKETLYSSNQILSAKVDAINLISFIKLISNDDSYDFVSMINQLTNDEELFYVGMDIILFDKTTVSILKFNFMMMKLVFNSIKLDEIVGLLSSYNELEVFEKVEALKTIVSLFEHEKASYIDEKIILLIIQFSLGLSNDKNHDVRFYATKALLHLLSNNNKVPIIKRLSLIMDYDSIYIKNQILNFSDKLKSIDKESYEFIIEKALVDNNYVIRDKAISLQHSYGDE